MGRPAAAVQDKEGKLLHYVKNQVRKRYQEMKNTNFMAEITAVLTS